MAQGKQSPESKERFAAARRFYARGRKALATARAATEQLLEELKSAATVDTDAIAAAEQELSNVRAEVVIYADEQAAIERGIKDGSALSFIPKAVKDWFGVFSGWYEYLTENEVPENTLLTPGGYEELVGVTSGIGTDETLVAARNGLTYYRAYLTDLGEVPFGFVLHTEERKTKAKKRGSTATLVAVGYANQLSDTELEQVVRSVYAHRKDEQERLSEATKDSDKESATERIAVCDRYLGRDECKPLVAKIEAAAKEDSKE